MGIPEYSGISSILVSRSIYVHKYTSQKECLLFFVTRVTQAILDCSDSTQQLCMQAHALVTAARVAPRAPHLGGEAQFDNSVSIMKLRAVSIL